jgi:hypothetical protein
VSHQNGLFADKMVCPLLPPASHPIISSISRILQIPPIHHLPTVPKSTGPSNSLNVAGTNDFVVGRLITRESKVVRDLLSTSNKISFEYMRRVGSRTRSPSSRRSCGLRGREEGGDGDTVSEWVEGVGGVGGLGM